MASHAGSTIQANLNDFSKQNRMKVAQHKGKLNSLFTAFIYCIVQ